MGRTNHWFVQLRDFTTVRLADNMVAPSYSQQSCTWMIRDDVFDKCNYLIVPAFWILCIGGVLAANDDEMILIAEVWVMSFCGLVEGHLGVWGGARNAFVVALMDLLVEWGMGVEDDGDADFEFDHGCGWCGKADKLRGELGGILSRRRNANLNGVN